MQKRKNKSPDHEGNIISHSRKWQESELQIWKVTCGVLQDDIVVKTEKRGTLLEDLRETFDNLRRFQIKLNPEKCMFGVPAGQLLGFLVSERAIECNQVKIKAIERMKIPTKL